MEFPIDRAKDQFFMQFNQLATFQGISTRAGVLCCYLNDPREFHLFPRSFSGFPIEFNINGEIISPEITVTRVN